MPGHTNANIAVYNRLASLIRERLLRAGHDPDALLFSRFVRPGAKILDAGAGAGVDLPRLSAMGYNVFALDAAVEMLRRSVTASGATVCGDIRALPFRPKSFDAVWCMSVLSLLTNAEKNRALHSFTQIMRPRGVLYITVWDGDGLFEATYGVRESSCWHTLLPAEGWIQMLRLADFSVLCIRREHVGSRNRMALKIVARAR
jgi:SAM-dependent methyltransferase